MSYTLIKLSRRYKRIHDLIQSKSTGSAHEFAKKMQLSEATLYKCLSFMKDQGIKLAYDHNRETYFYEDDQAISFNCGFEKNLID
ncbi:MAG: hypothetical protein WBA74_21525 [Cyclobacteriaceae bacterium]